MTRRGGQKQAYRCEYTEHRVSSDIIIDALEARCMKFGLHPLAVREPQD